MPLWTSMNRCCREDAPPDRFIAFLVVSAFFQDSPVPEPFQLRMSLDSRKRFPADEPNAGFCVMLPLPVLQLGGICVSSV